MLMTKELLKTDSRKEGLTSTEASDRLVEHGPNVLPSKPPTPGWVILVSQMESPLIYILLLAMVITAFLQDFSDTLVIGLAVFLNTVLGFIQEYRAQRSFHHLKRLITPRAFVRRDGEENEILASEVVVGDILILKTGMKVGADARLIETHALVMNEAILTGESAGVDKEATAPVYTGTTVLAGNGEALVVAIGLATNLGKIAHLIQETEDEDTPLQKQLSKLGTQLASLIAIVVILVMLLGIVLGYGLDEMFTTAVALAVAAIPEGLAVSLTAILAIGMQRILKRHALVRKLVAAETLGSTTVICTDKTGTLTEGKMRVVETFLVDEPSALRAMVLNNNRADQTEIALWDYVDQLAEWSSSEIESKSPRLDEVPFSSERKYMMTLHQGEGESNVLYVKGAPEVVLAQCELSPEERSTWVRRVDGYARRGLRVLALARAETGSLKLDSNFQPPTSNFQFLGLVGLEDPPRSGVKEALASTQEAGIRVVVITGDNRATAMAVMGELGLLVSDEDVLEGKMLDEMTLEELALKVQKIKLFARVSPQDKLKIVSALQKQGEVVAMTGDGVNDAPALKKADIGIVVDSATDVAKEMAEMVLLDSNFRTILAAVEEGRGIFDNLRKVILYLLSDCFSEIFLITSALALRLPLPLAASQILWINLITDGLPNLALTVDPKGKGILAEKPRRTDEPLMTFEIKLMIFLISFFTSLTSLAIFVYFWRKTGDVVYAQSLVFASLGLSSLLYVFAVRSLRAPLIRGGCFENKWLLLAVLGGLLLQISAFTFEPLRNLLGLQGIGIQGWGVALGASVLVILMIEVTKWGLLQRRGKTAVGVALAVPPRPSI